MGQVRPENDPRLKISVIICTLNRGILPWNVVKALLTEQTYKNFEIVIVDQSDNPYPESFRDPACREKVKYVHLERKNLPNARNVGIARSDGRIILFLDDDVEPDADLLYFHYMNYRNKKVGGVSGRVKEKVSLTNTSTAGGTIALSGRTLMNFESLSKHPVCSACGANMSFSRDAVEKTGNFDSRFDGISLLEEVDYSYRIRAAGYEIMYEPKASVNHFRAGAGGCRHKNERQALYARFRNTALFYRKNMSSVFLPYVFAVHFTIAAKKLFQSRIGVKDFFSVLGGFFRGLACYRRPAD
jgi:GT2 family glycosyltransferase